MKILLIHNKYGKFSGEEAVVESQINLLKSHGHEVSTYFRSSEEIKGLRGRVKSFFTGVYSAKSVREVDQLVAASNRRSARPIVRSSARPPDIVHIHNLYPLISPAILPVIKRAGIPIIMTVHNYRLVCPNGLFFTHGEICEKCAGGKEWNCILRNCENSYFKSTGYALRNWFARINKYYLDNVSAYICLTEFQKKKLIENGFPGERITVIPNTINIGDVAVPASKNRNYVAFAGRISLEKGVHLIFEAAKRLPGIHFKLAGKQDEKFVSKLEVPINVELIGSLSREEMQNFYNNAAFLLLPSIWYEGFPMVFLEAMAAGIPVIAPNMAGFPEIIEDGVNGLLFEPGNAEDLAKKIRILWEENELRTRLGENGRRKLEAVYSGEGYYRGLMGVYEKIVTAPPPAPPPRGRGVS
jgi:glycosyltransferase involved in cell wall biosynthesis